MRIKIMFVLLFLVVGLMNGCFITERERRGVSNMPFNTPPENEGRRTFNGDF